MDGTWDVLERTQRRRRARARRTAVAQFRSPERADGGARGRARPRRHHDGRGSAAPAGAAAAARPQWREGFQIVHAVRRDPPNMSWFKRTTSRLYYRMFAFMSGVEIEPGSADFCLLDRQGRRRGPEVRGGRPVPARARALGRLRDDERAVRVRRSATPARASTTCARCSRSAGTA